LSVWVLLGGFAPAKILEMHFDLLY
jgi:hypothetical protein